jgi:hypothetical protein
MPGSLHTVDLIAKAMLGGTAYAPPDDVELALCTTLPTASTAGTEVTESSYDRFDSTMSTDWTDNDDGSFTNTADIAYPELLDDYEADVVAVEAYDAADHTTRLWWLELVDPKTFVLGMTPTFLAGDLTFSVI